MTQYSYEYSTTYYPAMPVVILTLRRRPHLEGVNIEAIVDSGADATMIPLPYLEQIAARPREQKWLSGVTGGRKLVNLYDVSLQIGSLSPMYLPVVGDPFLPEAVLGRDVLNQFILTLNGLAHMVELTE